ncbi:hypothetical protein FRC17_008402 [Serendipita sp. 399]|nr:hypothetical protein FRC17_008402 [Serendipita sp. 399]
MANPQSNLRDSEAFPPGYGDIRLVSSDRVVFHCHQWLLAYMSPVFRDMFGIGGASNSREVVLHEGSRILDLIFRTIDPKQENPMLDFDILPHYLEAGRKYQIDEVKKQANSWLVHNASTVDIEASKLDIAQTIDLLENGTAYGVPRLCQVGLRNLIKAPTKEVFISRLATSTLFEHLVKLRLERVEWFQNKLSWILGAGVDVKLLSSGEFKMKDRLTMGIALEPSHKCCMHNWPVTLKSAFVYNVEDKLNVLEKECADLEAALPDLPQGFGV